MTSRAGYDVSNDFAHVAQDNRESGVLVQHRCRHPSEQLSGPSVCSGRIAAQRRRSATDLGVLRFGSVLLWPPPGLVRAVPVDRRGQAVLEVAVPGGPTQLGAQLRGVAVS